MSHKPLIKNEFQNFLFSKIKQSAFKSQKVVVDFSSPNVAKPFHPGHLRATLLGNFVCNINRVFCHDVKRINYLGDWGKQFGYLIHGLDTFKRDCSLEEMSMKDLYEVYVKSNQEFVSESDILPIKAVMLGLENSDVNLKDKWMNIKKLSVINLDKVYKRLGVEFDSYEFESDYVESSKNLMNQLKLDNKSFLYEDGALYYTIDNDCRMVLLSKEGLSLYMTRDIAAAIARHERYQPDRVHYVVENGQTLHFKKLQKVLSNLGYDYPNQSQELVPKDFHIKFGRVMDMSTRAGNVIFVDDILDHAKSLMITKLTDKEHVTLTHEEKLEQTAEDLGRTVIFCEFLRAPRQNSFRFVWDRDNLGFRFQYCRVSLKSLERRCAENNIEPNLADCFDSGNYDYFKDYESAMKLIRLILKFDEVLLHCYLESESCYLVYYVSKMTGLINATLKEINILNCPDKSEQHRRLALFSVSKFILDLSYEILGLPTIETI